MDAYVELVKAAGFGDLQAYGQLVQRFRNMAYGYAYSVISDFGTAEDVTQDAFLEAYSKLDSLCKPEAFPSWLRRIVFKHCDRYLRKNKIQTVSLEKISEVHSNPNEFYEKIEESEIKGRLLDMIKTMPDNERTVLTLFYMDNYSQKQISDFLEVPVTTVKNRLRTAKKQLQKGMLKMLNNVLGSKGLPENFAQRLLMYPFPKLKPQVKIEKCTEKDIEVFCIDSQFFFYPLQENGKCDWAFYDQPDGSLTGAYECHVISCAKWKERTMLRVWARYTDFKKDDKQTWQEQHIQVENEAFTRIQLFRENPGELNFERYKWKDSTTAGIFPMRLKKGVKGENSMGIFEVEGSVQITIGKQRWKCLKINFAESKGKTNDSPCVFIEWYVSEKGRTIFARRYNGLGFRPAGQPASFESLEGELEVDFSGKKFRHAYDCIPDFALTTSL